MTNIPEVCMAYTSVFKTLKFEMGICMLVGLVIGIIAAKLHDR